MFASLTKSKTKETPKIAIGAESIIIELLEKYKKELTDKEKEHLKNFKRLKKRKDTEFAKVFQKVLQKLVNITDKDEVTKLKKQIKLFWESVEEETYYSDDDIYEDFSGPSGERAGLPTPSAPLSDELSEPDTEELTRAGGACFFGMDFWAYMYFPNNQSEKGHTTVMEVYIASLLINVCP